MTPPTDISRREAVRRMSVLVGGALSSSTVSALLAGCQPATPAGAGWAPEVLSTSQLARLTVVVDRILPPTDTPGAAEAGVPSFIDRLLAEWAEPEQRDGVLAGLDGLDDACTDAFGAPFLDADADQQTELLAGLDADAARARDEGESDDERPWFSTLKEWTLVGYYTSEVGSTQELQWLALPGRWDADVPLSEVGHTWA